MEILILLSTISLLIYIIKSLKPIYYFIKDRLALKGERRRVRSQSILLKNRSFTLLAHGWFRCSSGFSTKGSFITNDEIRGWSDKKFKEYLNQKNNGEL